MATGRKVGAARRRALGILVGGGVVMAAIAVLGGLGGWRINLTPSEPIGLWRIMPLERPVAIGDLVFVCPPPGAVSAFGLERGYFRQGLCPSCAAPLIKTVTALAGSRIEVGAGVMIDGDALPRSELIARDGAGRPLIPWTGGIVPTSQIFVHSPFAGSYDSRYFGPIPDAGLLGLARPIFTLHP
ncbi:MULTISPECIES: conjugative transfer signal peptidase TraF [unclassified Chelatococcus]|uniref:conjugative transfer signal peptidase TraF n=1 Tax=unclassified Chelatococcus TaxID=2638111 RepID=UPI001BCA9970|nr:MULTISPECIES: conjugative transfer signal peptidase TraF [unclassified Chelatococcus]MBS7701573.1 conjugative transfer signal peptidase TraF [Chelatococcus sp. YT9]MBX3557408.1 conjugative transfer signal peptidase TraF [Chelatococcus sp.]